MQSVSCSSCGFPIAILDDSKQVKCPYCGQIGTVVTENVGTTVLLNVASIVIATIITTAILQKQRSGR